LETLQPPDLFNPQHPTPTLGRPRLGADFSAFGGKKPLVPHLSGLSPITAAEAIEGVPTAKDLPRLDVPEAVADRPTFAKQPHTRGIDLFVIDETKRWAQEARIALDMPLSAGPSGSAAFMLSAALELGLTGQEEKLEYTMALLASIVGGGHHTFHEVMTVARVAGVPYEDGKYNSEIYPACVRKLPAFTDLIRRYPQLFPGS
jgi:hypothetical protein